MTTVTLDCDYHSVNVVSSAIQTHQKYNAVAH